MKAEDPQSSDQQPEQLFVANPDQLSCNLSNEVVILNIRNNTYYGLNEVGAVIWKALKERPRTQQELCARVVQEFDVPLEKCASDVAALISELVKSGLVQPINK